MREKDRNEREREDEIGILERRKEREREIIKMRVIETDSQREEKAEDYRQGEKYVCIRCVFGNRLSVGQNKKDVGKRKMVKIENEIKERDKRQKYIQ